MTEKIKAHYFIANNTTPVATVMAPGTMYLIRGWQKKKNHHHGFKEIDDGVFKLHIEEEQHCADHSKKKKNHVKVRLSGNITGALSDTYTIYLVKDTGSGLFSSLSTTPGAIDSIIITQITTNGVNLVPFVGGAEIKLKNKHKFGFFIANSTNNGGLGTPAIIHNADLKLKAENKN